MMNFKYINSLTARITACNNILNIHGLNHSFNKLYGFYRIKYIRIGLNNIFSFCSSYADIF